MFLKTEIFIKDKKFKYYSSSILYDNKFKHGFFTKSVSEKHLPKLSTYLNKNHQYCVLNQIHSHKIVFGSQTQKGVKIDADGLVCDEFNQNLWIYTADCMPILFADKKRRLVAALHCGRKGLEKGIIKNLIKIFDKLGSSREDLLVAIGPSISKSNYTVDKKTLKEFCKKTDNKVLKISRKNIENIFNFRNLIFSKEEGFIQLDLREYAHMHLLNENIPNKNIDISTLCTYESNHEFYSWRRNKTSLRQWSFICT